MQAGENLVEIALKLHADLAELEKANPQLTSIRLKSGQALFLPLIASDYRTTLFYVDLMLVPMLVRLAIQGFGGKPYGLRLLGNSLGTAAGG